MPRSEAPPSAQLPLSRREFGVGLLGLALAGCSDSETVAVRYRVIAKITYNGRPYEASTVMECSYRRIKNSLIGAGGSTKLLGEALIFDLPNGKSLFILPWARDPNGGLRQFFEAALPRTIGIKHGVGSLSDDDFARLKTASGRFLVFEKGGLPALVAFDDETNPKTIFEIAPSSKYPDFPGVRPIGEVFPGVRFIGIEIEITDAAITKKLGERLTWLNTPSTTEVFDRVHGKRAYSDRPIGLLITTTHFFGLGS